MNNKILFNHTIADIGTNFSNRLYQNPQISRKTTISYQKMIEKRLLTISVLWVCFVLYFESGISEISNSLHLTTFLPRNCD
jgi:hypothetical protein